MELKVGSKNTIIHNSVTAALIVLFSILFNFESVKLNLKLSTEGFVLLAAYFLIALVIILPLGYFMRFIRLRREKRTLKGSIYVFLSGLLVFAIPEELLFRGLFQGYAQLVTGSKWVALIFATALFGAAHITTGKIWNWRYAFLATIAGFFFGLMYMNTASIIYPILLHALIIFVWWRYFFRGLI